MRNQKAQLRCLVGLDVKALQEAQTGIKQVGYLLADRDLDDREIEGLGYAVVTMGNAVAEIANHITSTLNEITESSEEVDHV